MKIITYLFLFFISLSVFAQTTYVPDDNFEQALIDLGYDDILDNYVVTANINTVTLLHVSSKNIADLTGIEDFTALADLYCYSNALTSLDVSQNTALYSLTCHHNNLISLDVHQNTALAWLHCHNNALTNLDVSQNTVLTSFSCNSNALTSLDVSQNTTLTGLFCFSNALTSLDVSQNTALTSLSCYSNAITSLDVSQNTALTILSCGSNALTSLDVFQNTALYTLSCYSNALTSLDVSQNTALISLYCYSNVLTSLDVSQNTALTTLICYSNTFTSLDVRNGNNTNISNSNFMAHSNPNLTCIYVDDASWSTANWTSYVDPASTFVETEAACNALNITGVEIPNISIFPNPANTHISIQTDEVLSSVIFYTILGKKVKEVTTKEIDISELASGTYFIKITTKSGKMLVKKIIKK